MENTNLFIDGPQIPNEQQEQRNFIASILLNAVNESLGESQSRTIHWDIVDDARKYLMNNPIAHLYFILLDIDIDVALVRLQRKWAALDRQMNRQHPYQIGLKQQQKPILH